eukprot:TRINITY_DN15846_c0_g1_i1.p1 TRINITY_DN15846_c0_g1~~TRINITY_DN15846_c0_g1_i1.p1  ORF type:complete len:166 (+),score=35.04 TRINITY_DN15846_c0_g1_i1:62-559(+)
MAHESLTAGQKAGINALFDQYDLTGTGKLSVDEILSVVKDLSLGLWRSHVISAMSMTCKSHDPLVVTKQEFEKLILELKRRSVILQSLKWDLQFMTASHREGLVNQNNAHLLAKMYKGTHYSEADVDRFLHQKGRESDKCVSVEDFEHYITDNHPTSIVSPAKLV